MRKLSFVNPEIMDILNHQVIHMDQGITYTPEYVATRQMRYYPSRTAQIIRSVWNGELKASEYGADMVFGSILSGQGERWQNFGEDPNSYILSVMLGRELFYQKGQRTEAVDALKKTIAENNGYLKKTPEDIAAWKQEIPVDEKSRTGLLLDETTFIYAKKSREKIGSFLKAKGIAVKSVSPVFTGFDFLAAGLIEEGIQVVQKLIAGWEAAGINKIVTLCGQSQYLFTSLLPYLEIDTEIQFISILDLAERFEAENAYIYGGSYFTRYLRKEAVLNGLLVNTTEEPLLSAPEFLPELQADKRKNVVGIWTPPLAAEYHPVGLPEGMADRIYENSLKVIGNTPFKTLIVCDPFAWKALQEKGYPASRMVYFTDVLK